MRLLSVIILLSFNVHLSLAQEDIKSWEFYHKLHATTVPQDSTDIRINLDSLNKEIFKNGQARFGIDTLPGWKFLCEYQYGWTESITMQQFTTTIDGVTVYHPGRSSYTSIFYPDKDSKKYCGGELFREFEFSTRYLRMDTSALHNFPDVPDRYAPLNMIWTPIMSGEYLMIRFVQSYPYGNQTSFYHEFILYFIMVR